MATAKKNEMGKGGDLGKNIYPAYTPAIPGKGWKTQAQTTVTVDWNKNPQWGLTKISVNDAGPRTVISEMTF